MSAYPMNKLISEIGAATKAGDPERRARAVEAFNAYRLELSIKNNVVLTAADRERLAAMLLRGAL